jgi:hypothetical protein
MAITSSSYCSSLSSVKQHLAIDQESELAPGALPLGPNIAARPAKVRLGKPSGRAQAAPIERRCHVGQLADGFAGEHDEANALRSDWVILQISLDDDQIGVDVSTDMGLTMHMASPSLGRAEAQRSTSAGGADWLTAWSDFPA